MQARTVTAINLVVGQGTERRSSLICIFEISTNRIHLHVSDI